MTWATVLYIRNIKKKRDGGRIFLSSVIHTCSARRNWTGIDATLSQCKCCNSSLPMLLPSSSPCRFPTKDDSIPKRRPWERGSLSPPTKRRRDPIMCRFNFLLHKAQKERARAHTHTDTNKKESKAKKLLAPLFVIRASKLTKRRYSLSSYTRVCTVCIV